MAEPLLSERQRSALRELVEAAANRASAATETQANFQTHNEAAERDLEQTKKAVLHSFVAGQAAAEREYHDRRRALIESFDLEEQQTKQEFSRLKSKLNHLFDSAKERLGAEFKEARWTITTIYDANKKAAKERYRAALDRGKAAVQKIKTLHHEAHLLLARWGLDEVMAEKGPAPESAGGEDNPCEALQGCAAAVAEKVEKLKSLSLPRYLRGLRLPVLLLLGWLVVSLPALLFEAWYFWLAGSTILALLAAWAIRTLIHRKAKAQVSTVYEVLYQSVAAAAASGPKCRKVCKAAYLEERAESKRRNQESLNQTHQAYKQKVLEAADEHGRELGEAETKYPTLLEANAKRKQTELAALEHQHKVDQTELVARRDSDVKLAQVKYDKLREDNNRRHAFEWTRLVAAWKQAVDKFRGTLREVAQECERLFPAWDDSVWESWRPPDAVPSGLPFGALDPKLERLPQVLPEDPHLPRPDVSGTPFPALLPFPKHASVLLKATDEGRGRAVEALQALMLRCLTAIPPGKVRFTILDPVGRGENFAAFMHLADHEELLVTGRIWTEATHIEQRLADLTAHMENVLQKYLRNRFETLEEYNAEAGEVAEPYRILVVANFPVNFSVDAARRLVSLANSGARCGIYTFISVDAKQPLPHGFDLGDLEQACLNLEWKDGRFLWKDPDFAPFPLQLERPPGSEFVNRLMEIIGRQAKIAGRVEVPFDHVAPPPEAWWTADSRDGVFVPLGKAGATAKQYLQLGEGTAQHALIAGKTGSGKSTLLHALITQVALHYSPDQVELYLVDFKKGVEFKTYAVHELPHARVVAVESEREFGLSVLQRLDAELKFRGERYRELGVTDLAAYRQARAAANGQGQNSANLPPLPRILLIVDEFQEFFVEDDKIAQEASLLLDRLVRQGRAFGIHVLLGSQTLGGAYSLARSTIDQMTVRIALQCSEADAHLILSKENSAARLLTRPGEAIYNAANGLLEGNNLFQVVWLSDERRDDVLNKVSDLAARHHFSPDQPQIVFEGTAPSDLRRNAPLQRLLQAPPAKAPTALTAWLGEAIAIKEPTAALFRRQSGANLLMVGQHAEAAFSMMVAALVGLAPQQPPREGNGLSPFYLAAGSSLEGPEEQFLPHLCEVLPVQLVSLRDLPATVTALGEEVESRHKTGAVGPPIFLFLHGLQRMRDLRRAEDDFGLSRREEKPSTAKQFAALVREGPVVGVFTAIWCDSFNNLGRTLDRQTLREFETRVLFQMSAADSSNLIDSPVATKLGLHRALFYTEDQGKVEKFRPYGLPALEWLQELHKRRAGSAAVSAAAS
jgi:S-DNA-T family DNA segregation ATPase FtsK/SpoIIIE